MSEATDRDEEAHLGPTEMGDQLLHYPREANAVKGIMRMLLSHGIQLIGHRPKVRETILIVT